MTPSREEIEAAIHRIMITTEDLPDTTGVFIVVSRLRVLVKAARWALELLDDDNPPLLPEEREALRPKEKKDE
jgi:hypothetical protein